MRRAERLTALRRGIASLCGGALVGGVLLAGYTSVFLVERAGVGLSLFFDGARFLQVLPRVVAGLCAIFLVLGPLVQRLRSVAGLDDWWGAALAGALVAFALLRAVAPDLRLDPHLSHSLIGAAAAAAAHAWHGRADRGVMPRATDIDLTRGRDCC